MWMPGGPQNTAWPRSQTSDDKFEALEHEKCGKERRWACGMLGLICMMLARSAPGRKEQQPWLALYIHNEIGSIRPCRLSQVGATNFSNVSKSFYSLNSVLCKGHAADLLLNPYCTRKVPVAAPAGVAPQWFLWRGQAYLETCIVSLAA